MNESDVLKKVITKILGITTDEYADLVYQKEDGSDDIVLITNASDLILTKNSDKIQAIKQEGELKFDNGFKKAQKDVLGKIEKEFKENTGYVSDKQGIELFVSYAESIREQVPTDPTEDQIKKTSTYRDMETKKDTDKEDAVKSVQDDYDKFKTGITSDKVQSKIEAKAWDLLMAKKPNVQTGKIGENNKKAFLLEFRNYSFVTNGDDDIDFDKIGIEKGDKRLEDGHGNPIKYHQLVDNIAVNHYTFEQQDPKGNAGNQGGNQGGTEGNITFESEAHYLKLMNKNENNRDELRKIGKAWDLVKDKF